MDFLKKITLNKRSELMARKILRPEADLRRSPMFQRTARSLTDRLNATTWPGIIAEFKRKSPSRGWLRENARVADIIPGYRAAGAAAVSVLTDEDFFSGSLDDLLEARSVLDLPILRKDFIIDPYQLVESKSFGADVVLLIAAILDEHQMVELFQCAVDLGLEVLVEIHHSDELGRLPGGIRLLGINNRDLSTFDVRADRALEILPALPAGVLPIAESGISDAGTVNKLWKNGFKGFLIGEYFMKQDDPGLACTEFIKEVKSKP
jgi:indole-3-glycerol phosphate synthase